MAQNQTEMMNSLSIIKHTVERIVGVEGGITVTGVGAMEEEYPGLREENASVAGGIRNWLLGGAVGGATNTSASEGMGDGGRAVGGISSTSTSTGVGYGSLGLGRVVGGVTNTSTSTGVRYGSLGFGRVVGGVTNTSTSTGVGYGSLGFGRVVGGVADTSTSAGMADGSLGLGRAMGGTINSVGGMGDWSLGSSRLMGEVSTADDLVGGLNVPEVGEGFRGPMSRNCITGSGGNDRGSLGMGDTVGGISVSGVGGIGVGMGVGGLGGLLGYVREGTTSAGCREDVMRTRSVDDLYTLTK